MPARKSGFKSFVLLMAILLMVGVPSALPAVDLTVGLGCGYPTISAAVAAAASEDRLLLEGGRVFLENLNISKNLILEGGYPGCASASTDRTTIDGRAAAAVFYISAQNVSLNKINVTNGKSSFEGGGIDFIPSGGVGTITLTDMDIYGNASSASGGGIWVGTGANATLTNVKVENNTATLRGGGLRIYYSTSVTIAGESTFNYNDSGTEGGAISVEGTNALVVGISGATIQYNRAGGNGGAIALTGGAVTFSGWWDLQSNHSSGNGGAVAVSGLGKISFKAEEDRDSTLAFNYASGNGGGIYTNNNETVTLYGTKQKTLRLHANTSGGSGGLGTADNGGFFDIYGLVDIAANIATENGGAFFLSGGSKIWLDDYLNDKPKMRLNRAQNGGAIYALGSPRVEGDGIEIDGNVATVGSGGAIYLDGSAFHATNGIFRNNRAALHGGAMAGFNGATITIDADYPQAALRSPSRDSEGSSLNYLQATACNPLTGPCSSLYLNSGDSDSNLTGYGGGIYSNNGSFNISDTVFRHNSAVRGGAIYQEGAAASGQVSNSLLYANKVAQAFGAGIRSTGGNFLLTHVTLADNTGGAGYSHAGTATTVYNSIAWGNTSGGFWMTPFAAASCNIDQSNMAGLASDPKFLYPVDTAGKADYHLQTGSPAIDACDTNGLAKDLDNRSRPIGSKFDMGAYEALGGVFLPIILNGN